MLIQPQDLGECVRCPRTLCEIVHSGFRSKNIESSRDITRRLCQSKHCERPVSFEYFNSEKDIKAKCECAEYELKCREVGERITVEFYANAPLKAAHNLRAFFDKCKDVHPVGKWLRRIFP